MAIVKRTDIYEGGKAFAELSKEIDGLTLSVKNLQTETRKMQKSGSGAEAKQRVDLTKELTIQTNKLVKAEGKQAKELALLKAANAQRNKELRIEAQETLKITGAYSKQSKRLNDLRKRYKDLAVTEKASTREAKNLLVQITKLDTKLKQVDNSVGQNQRSVGKYGNALKGLGSQLLGAAGITVGLSAVVQGLQSVAKRSNELIEITKKIEQTFNVTSKAAKTLAADVLAIANNFDSDYNEVLKSANAVSKELGISATEALGHIEEGFLKGSNNSGEFLDILKEYPTQFKAAGIDAKTMFSIINQQVKEGIYSDKGVDAIKEGGLRLRENTKAVQAALAPLDESIRKQIEQEIAAGNSFKAIQLVSEALKDTSLSADETQTIIADVFGGAGEDAGLRYLQMLSDIEGNLDDVAIQATINEQANLKLSKSWNKFVASAFSDSGLLSKAWTNIKQVVINALDQINVLVELAGGGSSAFDALSRATAKFKKEQLKISKAQLIAYKKEQEELAKLNAEKERIAKAQLIAYKKEQEELAKLNAEKERRASIKDENVGITQIGAPTIPTGVDPNAGKIALIDKQRSDGLISEADYQDKLNEIREEKAIEGTELINEMLDADKEARREKEQEDLYNFENAKTDIKLAALDGFASLASDLYAQGQDEKINKIRDDNEAEQQLLKDKLDKNEITDEQYRRKTKELNKKARIEEAKANKKKAIFDIVIGTLLGVIKAIANTGLPAAIPLIVATIALGAINAALVAAEPLPTAGDGMINISGKPHSMGGKNINVEGGESIITKVGTSNAPETLDAINKGSFKDGDMMGLSKEQEEGLLASLLMQGNDKSDKILTVLANGVSQYELNGKIYTRFANGAPTNERLVNK